MTTTTQQPTKKSNKEVKVIAINVLHEYAKQFYEYEKKHFSQFLGVDIFKVNGSLKAKYEHDKIDFSGQLKDGTFVNANYWFTYSYNSFDIHVKICVNGGTYDVRPATAFCQYEEMTLTLFKTDSDNKLIETDNDISHLSTRYNLADLVKIETEINEAKKNYEAAENKMPYRFRDVFYIGRITTR